MSRHPTPSHAGYRTLRPVPLGILELFFHSVPGPVPSVSSAFSFIPYLYFTDKEPKALHTLPKEPKAGGSHQDSNSGSVWLHALNQDTALLWEGKPPPT